MDQGQKLDNSPSAVVVIVDDSARDTVRLPETVIIMSESCRPHTSYAVKVFAEDYGWFGPNH